jgi:hypothetical protein
MMRIFERLRALRESISEPAAGTDARLPIDLIDAEFEKDHCCGGCMGQSHGSPAHGEH